MNECEQYASKRKRNRICNPSTVLLLFTVAAATLAVSRPTLANGISLEMVNNCSVTLWAHGENTPGQGAVTLPHNDQSIASGGSWSTTLPVPWVSGRVWVCPSSTSGKDPWATDSQFYTFGCTWIEPTTGTNSGVPFVNLNPTYIDGIWLPAEISRSGGACSGSPCTATCSGQPTVATIQADCPTGTWSQYNGDKCLAMNPFCDPGLGAGHDTDARCQQTWLAAQLTVCENTYAECKTAFGQSGDPTPFEVYGCGNGYPWLTTGFGQEVCAALNRGVIDDQSHWTNAEDFYPSGVQANDYSEWIHNDLGCEAYAFPYDDTSVKQGGDMTYTDPNGDLKVTVTWCPWG